MAIYREIEHFKLIPLQVKLLQYYIFVAIIKVWIVYELFITICSIFIHPSVSYKSLLGVADGDGLLAETHDCISMMELSPDEAISQVLASILEACDPYLITTMGC